MEAESNFQSQIQGRYVCEAVVGSGLPQPITAKSVESRHA